MRFRAFEIVCKFFLKFRIIVIFNLDFWLTNNRSLNGIALRFLQNGNTTIERRRKNKWINAEKKKPQFTREREREKNTQRTK